MTVRAKFKVESVTRHETDGSVKLIPVTSGSEENEEFFKWTPYGSIEMGVVNEDVLERFVPGKEVYVDFTEVDDPG